MVDPGREGSKAGTGVPDGEHEQLLRRAIEVLGHRPAGYRPTWRPARAALAARAAGLGLGVEDYLRLLRASAAERQQAEWALAVPADRFFRGRSLWRRLADEVLPIIAHRRQEGRIWCADCGRGEQAWSVALRWIAGIPTAGRALRVVATDPRPDCLEQARAACFPATRLGSVPAAIAARWLAPAGGGRVAIADEARRLVSFARHDLAVEPWPRELDLVFLGGRPIGRWPEERGQALLERVAAVLQSHSWLVLGHGEPLPPGAGRWFEAVDPLLPLYRRRE